MISKIEVFTSPTCPHCPSALNLAKQIEKERSDVKVIETSSISSQGRKRAQMYNVMSVPTVFVNGPHFDRIGFRGTPPKSKLLEAIDISLGLKEWTEPKSFIERIKEKIPLKIKF
jgi:thioredoxin 1